MKQLVHFTLFLLIDAKLAVSLGSDGCRRKRAKKRLHYPYVSSMYVCTLGIRMYLR